MLFFRKSIRVLPELVSKITLPQSTRRNINLHLESHDYRIYYVNIDLRHQYGISVTESQTFLSLVEEELGEMAVFAGYPFTCLKALMCILYTHFA